MSLGFDKRRPRTRLSYLPVFQNKFLLCWSQSWSTIYCGSTSLRSLRLHSVHTQPQIALGWGCMWSQKSLNFYIRLHSVRLGQHNVPLLPFGLLFPTTIHIGKIKLKLTPRTPQRVKKLLQGHIVRICGKKDGGGLFNLSRYLGVLWGITFLLFLSLSWPSPLLLPMWGWHRELSNRWPVIPPNSTQEPNTSFFGEDAMQNKQATWATHLLRPTGSVCLS